MMSPLFRHVADGNQRTLVDAGGLVRTLELLQAVDIDAGLGGIDLFGGADNDTGRVHLVDDALAAGDDRGAESRATTGSMPVPTNGASARSSGTA